MNMKDLNNLVSEIVIQDRIDLVSEMESVFDQMCEAIDSDSFEKELKYKDKTLVVDLGRQKSDRAPGIKTTNVIIRIFHEGTPLEADQEEERIYMNGEATDYFNYAVFNNVKLKDFTPEQVAIMQFVKEDFEKQLAILQGRNQEEVNEDLNEIFEEIQEDIAEEIQIPKSSEVITDPSELLPEGMRPANVTAQDFLRLAAQVARIQGVIELAEKNKKSALMITFAVLSYIFFAEDCYQHAIWLYHKLLALNFIK